MKTALESVKDLQIEVKQAEHRLEFIKTEVASLQRQKDTLATDAANTRISLEADVQKKMTLLREETAKTNEAKDKLAADKAEFEGLLRTHRIEKSNLEAQQVAATDAKLNYDQMTEKVGQFVRLMKLEAAKL